MFGVIYIFNNDKRKTVELNMKTERTAPTSNLSKITMANLLVTMGIVFGDIGTSPLYVMKAIVGVSPDYSSAYILGAISCVIWTLTLQTTLKYVVIALRADNKGEGGFLRCFRFCARCHRVGST